MRFIQPAVLFDVCPNFGVSISCFVLDKGYTLDFPTRITWYRKIQYRVARCRIFQYRTASAVVHLKSWRSFRTPFDVDSWIFSKFARLGDKILDTHLGSGSSRIAAYEAELDFVGFEIDMEYFQEQEKRFDTHISQLSIFAGGGTLDLCY